MTVNEAIKKVESFVDKYEKNFSNFSYLEFEEYLKMLSKETEISDDGLFFEWLQYRMNK